MNTTYNKIAKIFESYPNILFGFSDIPFTDYKMKYTGALVFAVPHAKMLKIDEYDEETLTAPLSFKSVAVHAGLGWIGKNGVLVTEKYGPRVRLSVLLINVDFPNGTPVVDSKCPKECHICVNACPHNALKGQQWNINSTRSEIIDYHLCNQRRSLYIKSHNRKHSCGFCMVSCPCGF